LASNLAGLTAYEAVGVLADVQKTVLEAAYIQAPNANDLLHRYHSLTIPDATRDLDNTHGALLAGAVIELSPDARRRGLSVIPNAG